MLLYIYGETMTCINKVTIYTITVSFFLIIHAIPHAAFAQVPEHTVYRATGKIILDGIIDEADWESAQPVGEFVFPWWTEGEKEQTEVKMLWNDTYLYLAMTVDDKHVWADHYDTNSWTYKDDAVEFFWNPNPDAGDIYYFFEMNCAGNLLCVYDYWGGDFLNNEAMVPRIGPNVRGTVNNDADTDNGWTLEIAIRFSDYPELSKRENPIAGDVWRVNFNRCGGKTNYQYSQWSPSQTAKPNFHRPDDFGKLVFSDRLVTDPAGVNDGDSVSGYSVKSIDIKGIYPNPFNPSTTIEYSLPGGGYVELTIYNSANQKVRTLIESKEQAGFHSVVWDGKDDNGFQVSSGVYISHLRMGEHITTGRMTLVK